MQVRLRKQALHARFGAREGQGGTAWQDIRRTCTMVACRIRPPLHAPSPTLTSALAELSHLAKSFLPPSDPLLRKDAPYVPAVFGFQEIQCQSHTNCCGTSVHRAHALSSFSRIPSGHESAAHCYPPCPHPRRIHKPSPSWYDTIFNRLACLPMLMDGIF